MNRQPGPGLRAAGLAATVCSDWLSPMSRRCPLWQGISSAGRCRRQAKGGRRRHRPSGTREGVRSACVDDSTETPRRAQGSVMRIASTCEGMKQTAHARGQSPVRRAGGGKRACSTVVPASATNSSSTMPNTGREPHDRRSAGPEEVAVSSPSSWPRPFVVLACVCQAKPHFCVPRRSRTSRSLRFRRATER